MGVSLATVFYAICPGNYRTWGGKVKEGCLSSQVEDLQPSEEPLRESASLLQAGLMPEVELQGDPSQCLEAERGLQRPLVLGEWRRPLLAPCSLDCRSLGRSSPRKETVGV